MPDEPRKPKIGPAKPTGSFVSKEKILDKVNEDKLREME